MMLQTNARCYAELVGVRGAELRQRRRLRVGAPPFFTFQGTQSTLMYRGVDPVTSSA